MLKTFRRVNRRILDILVYGDKSDNKIFDEAQVVANTLEINVYLLDDDMSEFFYSSSSTDTNNFYKFKDDHIQRDNILSNNSYYISSPLISSNHLMGYLIFEKSSSFSEEEIIIFESFKILCIVSLQNILKNKNYEIDRQISVVKNSIASLSYSEMHAISAIFNELDAEEGIIVASYVSKKYAVSRSVIVSALRKLESSSVIESRSLGAKGTYIKVLNPYLTEQIEIIKGDFIKWYFFKKNV